MSEEGTIEKSHNKLRLLHSIRNDRKKPKWHQEVKYLKEF